MVSREWWASKELKTKLKHLWAYWKQNPTSFKEKKFGEHVLKNPGLKRIIFPLQQVGMLYVSLSSGGYCST